MRRCLSIASCLAVLAMCTSCHSLDDDRIPYAPVSLAFYTVHDWDTYGTPSALDHKRFIIQERIPSNFPYSASMATGFGGVLLVGDVLGEPRAYDLACPVEAKSSVRISVDKETMLAECPVCHSTYDIFSLAGHPVSGKAAEKGFGLRVYRVGRGQGNFYMIVTN